MLLNVPTKLPPSRRMTPERLRALYVAAAPEARILYPPERLSRLTRASARLIKAALR